VVQELDRHPDPGAHVLSQPDLAVGARAEPLDQLVAGGGGRGPPDRRGRRIGDRWRVGRAGQRHFGRGRRLGGVGGGRGAASGSARVGGSTGGGTDSERGTVGGGVSGSGGTPGTVASGSRSVLSLGCTAGVPRNRAGPERSV